MSPICGCATRKYPAGYVTLATTFPPQCGARRKVKATVRAILFAEDTLTMRGAIFTLDGSERAEATHKFALDDSSGPVILARQLLAQASPAIREHFEGE